MNKEYDVAICYRIYPKIAKTPIIFPDNKLKLSEFCLASFKQSLNNVKFKMWVLLDGCPKEYNELFLKYFEKNEIELINLQSLGNGATFIKQTEILLAQSYSDYIYFAEDDYFYLPDTFVEMLNFMKSRKDVHFISPFDHSDSYTMNLHLYKNEIAFSLKRHWRTAGSTCMTFLTSKSILNNTIKIFKTYESKNSDVSLWFSITKTDLFNILNLFKKIFINPFELKIFLKCWYYSPILNLITKKYKLWTPLPSIALHLESSTTAPVVDWQHEFEKQLKKINF